MKRVRDVNEEQQIGMMLIAEGYGREDEDKSLIIR